MEPTLSPSSPPQPLSPSAERYPGRPRVTLQIPTSPYSPSSPYPMSASTTAGLPPNYDQYANPFNNSNLYQRRSTFMFKQFEGFRDFTMNTAKSGLSVGEKSAFWIYNKFSNWSKKWFTHFFLILIVMLYSLAGAALFVFIEGWFVCFFILLNR